MALHKILFDSSSAAGRGDTHTIGAVLYDQANDRLGVINASNQLEVHDADILSELQGGISVDDGGGSLTVDATDLDIRDLTHVSDSIKIGDGTDFLAVNGDGSINAVVTATQLDIDDLNATDDAVAAWVKDGSGNAISSTAGALDVNIASGDIDDSLANTAIKQVVESVGTTAAVIVDGADELASRKFLMVYNNDTQDAFIGDSGVTTANGFPIPPGAILETRIGDAVDVYMIGDKAAMDIRTLQLS